MSTAALFERRNYYKVAVKMNRKILCILAVLMLIVLMFSFTACFDTQEKEKDSRG